MPGPGATRLGTFIAFLRVPCAILMLLPWLLPPGPAQAADQDIHVATRILSPLVQQQEGRLGGFSIDLWNEISKRNHWVSHYDVAPNVTGQLSAVGDGAADVGVGAISITAQRDLQFDFSQPILGAGLQIMIRSQGDASDAYLFQNLLHLLFSPSILIWLGIAAALTIVPAHVVWFVERRHPEGIVGSGAYFPGIFQAFFWGLGTLATQADSMPRHWISRLVAIVWMFTSVVYVAFYTATLTASLTVQQIKGGIGGPADLPGRNIATIVGSTAASYLQDNNIVSISFNTIDDAYRALAEKKADAIVYDAPVLQYLASHQGLGNAVVVGPVFQPEYYGFAFRGNSPLRRPVDLTLLALREDGTYDHLLEKWFGSRVK